VFILSFACKQAHARLQSFFILSNEKITAMLSNSRIKSVMGVHFLECVKRVCVFVDRLTVFCMCVFVHLLGAFCICVFVDRITAVQMVTLATTQELPGNHLPLL
jgi:hypothetical protein